MSVPKLRFKDFNGNWERIKLSQMGTFKNGINKDKEDFGHGVPFINLMDVFGKNSICQNTFDLVNASSKEIEAYSLKQGDVLFIRSSVKPEGVAETAVVLEDLDNTVYSGFLIRYRPSKDIDLHYKKYCFSTDFFRKNVLALSTTSANTNINQESLSLLNLDLPSKPEQTKIASFLSAVDEKISQLAQKHELLSQYKQGMMQKLFSQQIRFKADDGSEFGEWEDYKIFDLAKDGTLNNGVFNDQNKVGAGYKLINVLDMYIKRDIDESKLSLLDLNKKEFEKNKVNYGDIFFTRSSLVKEGIAFSNVYLGVSDDITYDGHLIKLSPDLNMVEPKFLNYCLKISYVRKQLIQGGKTATMTTIGQQEVGNTLVKIPCLEEQTKIANFLSSIDQKIEVVAQQIEQAKQWKKGLLQQMFV